MLSFLKRQVGIARSWWFDFSHNVETRHDVLLNSLTTSGSAKKEECAQYMPTSPRVLPRALAGLGNTNWSAYTFVDYGSGKGRILLIAARYPFARVVGIEFAAELHEQCVINLRNYRGRLRSTVLPRHLDALQYELPNTPCVLFFYFPFRKLVMKKVFERIEASIRENPRDVAVIQVSEWEWIPALMEEHGFTAVGEDHFFRLYRHHRSIKPGKESAMSGRTGKD